MSLFNRLRYALYLMIATTMIVGLVVSIASADAVALLPAIDAGALVSHPLYLAAVYLASFIAAPWFHEHFPIHGSWK